MESNEDKKETGHSQTDFWKRSNHELLDGDKLHQIKEAAKLIRANKEEDSYDKAKVAALVEQMSGMFASTTNTDSRKIGEAFSVLYNLVETNIIMTTTPNDRFGANYNNLGLELLNMFKKHYLPTIKDYSPVTKARWRKEDAEAGAAEKKVKLNDTEEKAKKERKAKKVLERETIKFLMKNAVDAHFKEIDQAEKELPIDDETKNIIETARQILQKIEEENEPSRWHCSKSSEEKAKSEAQESLFDKIASKPFHASDRKSILSTYEEMCGKPAPDSFVNTLDALIKYAPPLAPSKDDKEAFIDLLKAAEADDDFKLIVHNEDED